LAERLSRTAVYGFRAAPQPLQIAASQGHGLRPARHDRSNQASGNTTPPPAAHSSTTVSSPLAACAAGRLRSVSFGIS